MSFVICRESKRQGSVSIDQKSPACLLQPQNWGQSGIAGQDWSLLEFLLHLGHSAHHCSGPLRAATPAGDWIGRLQVAAMIPGEPESAGIVAGVMSWEATVPGMVCPAGSYKKTLYSTYSALTPTSSPNTFFQKGPILLIEQRTQ